MSEDQIHIYRPENEGHEYHPERGWGNNHPSPVKQKKKNTGPWKWIERALLGFLYVIIYIVAWGVSLFSMDCDEWTKWYLRLKEKCLSLTCLGLSITGMYVLVILLVIASPVVDIKTLELNELGDFCAGVFGPLTLFWLIIGYFLQKKELEQNTSALRLQADELKNSVEQQKKLIGVTQNQVNAELKSLKMKEDEFRQKTQPKFVIVRNESQPVEEYTDNGKLHYREFEIEIVNNGQDAFETEFIFRPMRKGLFGCDEKISIFKNGDSNIIRWSDKDELTPEDFRIVIYFKDINEVSSGKEFMLLYDGDGNCHDVTLTEEEKAANPTNSWT